MNAIRYIAVIVFLAVSSIAAFTKQWDIATYLMALAIYVDPEKNK